MVVHVASRTDVATPEAASSKEGNPSLCLEPACSQRFTVKGSFRTPLLACYPLGSGACYWDARMNHIYLWKIHVHFFMLLDKQSGIAERCHRQTINMNLT